jgi:hypothetical protein
VYREDPFEHLFEQIGTGHGRRQGMRRYDDPVEVRRGRVASGTGSTGSTGSTGADTVTLLEGPEQFLWRGRLWRVSQVLAHWVETGPWWRSSGVHAVLGADDGVFDGATEHTTGGPARVPADLVAERDVWRVEADRGRDTGRGVFDLVFDWADGSWRLSRCQD